MGLRESEAAVERFRRACERDERVVAAFLGGSLASGRADEYSDLDLYVIVREDACAELVERRHDFVAAWGDPVFTDVTSNFEGLGFDMVHFVMSDGTNGELAVGHPGNFQSTHGGPYRVLVDETGLLEGVEFPMLSRSPEERRSGVERALSWFWLHTIGLAKALGRDRLWVAQWQLNRLRGSLWDLLAAAQLSVEEASLHEHALSRTFVPLERAELLRAARLLVQTYRALAPTAPARHDLTVPEPLPRLAGAKLPAQVD